MKDLEKQMEFLNEIKNDVQIILSSIVQSKVYLDVVESKDYANKIYYKFESEQNFVSMCGMMAICFEDVKTTSSLYWNESGLVIDFKYEVKYKDCESNGFRICGLCVDYKSKFVKIMR